MAFGESGASEVAADQGNDTATDKDGKKLDLLPLVREEMRRAIGFENDQELKNDRDRALNYFKGDVKQDIPSLPNRSKAVSSDVSDAIETILPDLMEIFTGGDDVVALIPQSEQDVEPAKQETAYLNHVVFQDNSGFLNFYTAIKDALLLKTGIFTWEWEADINETSEDFTGKNIVELQDAYQDGKVTQIKAEKSDPEDQTAMPTYSFTVTKTKDKSKAKYWAVPPDDFAAAPDTINIGDTTYCVMRSRPRVQDLIAEGYDKDKVRNLEAYTAPDNTTTLARDTAGENSSTGGAGDDTSADLRQVEIRKHYIRVLGDDDELELWCIVSDAQATVELDSYKIERINFAIGSPYLVAHRLIGLSLADMLIEVMRIKTALSRAVLDSSYFALNQRHEVADVGSNEFTMSDLMNNVPAMPVRVKTSGTVNPIPASGMGFDPYAALEYFSTVAEQRTGVVRNAQGLNPDTLHDTASGAMMLLSAAQKRTKMIARILAETLIKPFYLGMHAEIRENASSETITRLLGKWVKVDPTKWAERNEMTVEVGLGASGKDMEIAAMNQIGAIMGKIVEEQGGAQGPIVTTQNVYQASIDLAKKLGAKSPEEYFTDPSTAPPQPPKPDPDMAKVQGQQQLQQQKQQADQQAQQAQMQADQQAQQQKLSGDIQMAKYKAQTDAAVTTQQNQLEHERMVAQQQGQMELEQLKIQSAERIAIEVARINAEAKISAAQVTAANQTSDGSATLQYEESNETRA